MTDRRWIGSWMSGVRSPAHEGEYPGEDLRLPRSGAGSVSGVGRRVGALVIDWLLCYVIALGLLRSAGWTLAIFAAETALLTAFTGFTVGKRLLGIRVVRLDGKPVGGWALVRTILVLAVIPPVVMDSDLRGLHDKAANTVVVRI